MTRRISPAAAILLAVAALAAQLAPGAGHAAGRVALVIGNADYADAPLRNPVNDARAMADRLDGLGFEVIRLENATKEQMERAIVELVGRLDQDSSALFYYAGHGVQVRGRNYLVPIDARIEGEREVRIESVGVNLLLDELAYAGNRLNIVILDACRNNPFARRIRGMSRGLAAVDAARGTLIAYATAPGSVALDGDGENGLYTEALLRALDRPGLKAEEVFKRVRIEVARRTRNQQIPWESSSLTGDFVFNASAARPTTASRGETAFWESADELATADAYRAYLEQFPGGVFATLARLRIAELEAAAPAPAPQATGEPAPVAPAVPQPAVEAAPPANVASLDTKSAEPLEADTGIRTDEGRNDRPSIAILPLEGAYWLCQEPFDEAAVLKVFRGRMVSDDIAIVSRDSPGEAEAAELERLWRSRGLRKEPDAKSIYAYGERLGVDGVMAVWYEVSGPYCGRTDLDARIFDVDRRSVYREQGSGANASGVADEVVSRFLEARRSTGGGVASGSGETPVHPSRLETAAASPPPSPAREQAKKDWYKIAVPPAEGAAFMCHEPFDPEPLVTTFTEEMSAKGVTPARYAYLAASSELSPDELWRSTGLRKRPDAQTAYRHARGLGVDAMLVVWYEVSGWSCDRVEVDVRIFDAALDKTYREQATNADIEKAAEALVSRFLEGRAVAGRTP